MSAATPPLYASIYHTMLGQVRRGAPRYRDKLPSERELMAEFATTRVTLRIALSQLEREGIIYRSNRRGWFVAPEKLVLDPTLKTNFSALATEQGRVATTEVLAARQLRCRSAAQGAPLGLKRGDPMYQLQRRRNIDGRPVLLENISVNGEYATDLLDQDLSSSLTSVFRDYYSIDMAREEVTINATALSREQAGLLGVADGSACISLCRTRFNQSGQIVEYDEDVWLHNAIEIHVATTVR
ncbi:MAG: UTRA domain-containing protein [Porticoccaceae bacterium]|nr:UTRA domain-containing protein [Porticoccaceae bacterium]